MDSYPFGSALSSVEIEIVGCWILDRYHKTENSSHVWKVVCWFFQHINNQSILKTAQCYDIQLCFVNDTMKILKLHVFVHSLLLHKVFRNSEYCVNCPQFILNPILQILIILHSAFPNHLCNNILFFAGIYTYKKNNTIKSQQC